MPPLILSQREALGHPVFVGNLNPNLTVERLSWQPDVRDDVLHLDYQIEGQWVSHRWPCSSVPSSSRLRHPAHPGGTAILSGGHHARSHMLGWHPHASASGRRRAVVAARALPVYRDNNRDAVVDWDVPTSADGTGINIHDGRDSLGCITVGKATIAELVYLLGQTTHRWGQLLSVTVLNPETTGPPRSTSGQGGEGGPPPRRGPPTRD